MTQNNRIMIRMDDKLYEQLKKYADRNDESVVSVSARKAIRLFIEEQKLKDNKFDTNLKDWKKNNK